jgi:hypothetical protein
MMFPRTIPITTDLLYVHNLTYVQGKMYSTAYKSHFPAMYHINKGYSMSYSIKARLHRFLTTTQAISFTPPTTFDLSFRGKVQNGQKHRSHSIL